MKKLTRYPWLTVFIVALIGFFNLQNSSNPSPDYTGRTSTNCTQCHPGSLNPSGASIALAAPAKYYPGKKYSMTLTVTGGVRYGFQGTIVETLSTSTGAGTFGATTGVSVTSQSGRSYARHSSKISSGVWTVDWTAPSSNVGSVTYYFCGNAANNNGSTSGDKIVTAGAPILALDKITFSTSIINNPCFGDSVGSIKFDSLAGGEGAPYTFGWPGTTYTGDSLTNLKAGTYSVTVYDRDSNFEISSVQVTQPQGIQPTISQSPSICGDSTGKAWLSPTGGSAPYTITWAAGIQTSGDTAVNLKAGTYAFTVTDANACTASGIAPVATFGTIIQLLMDSLPEYCGNSNGEAIVSSVSGAQGSVSYLWDDGSQTASITGLNQGNYRVTVTDSLGCQQSATVHIDTATTPIQYQLDIVNDKCGQGVGSAKVTQLQGGIGTYTYLWGGGSITDSIGGLNAGMVQVSVTDSVGCTVVHIDTVRDDDAPQTTLSKTDLACHGDSSGSIRVQVIGGQAPYMVQWSGVTGIDTIHSNLSAGKYLVTVTDANLCEAKDSIIVDEPDALERDSLNIEDTYLNACIGEAKVVSKGGTQPYSYNWPHNQAMTQQVDSLCEGSYVVEVTDANQCTYTDTIVVSTKPNELGLYEAGISTRVQIFPSPASEHLYLKSNGTMHRVTVRSIQGTLIVDRMLEADYLELMVTEWPAGSYLILVETESGKSIHTILKN